ncbi:hypothetical protein B0J14DRAFT_566988 [Halenospora varia]|nr:hypothetical protein B0J14DRAFT_566988 [Halenospora varia]
MNAYPAFILEIEQGIWINNFFIQLYREIGKVVEKLLCIPLLFSLVDISSIGSRWAKTNQVVMMANASATEAVNISEIEHNLGVLSSANLQTAKIFINSAWRSLWPRGGTEVESEASRVLRG